MAHTGGGGYLLLEREGEIDSDAQAFAVEIIEHIEQPDTVAV